LSTRLQFLHRLRHAPRFAVAGDEHQNMARRVDARNVSVKRGRRGSVGDTSVATHQR
jgi:hypothetical protein